MKAAQHTQAQFEATRWSIVIEAKSPAAPEALNQLCQIYWPPIYAFIRRQGCSPSEAEDLAQGFFGYLLEHQAFSGVAPEKGKFRSFLLSSLANFLNNERDRAKAQKRGGAVMITSLDAELEESRHPLELADGSDPGKLFDRRWAFALIDEARRKLEQKRSAQDDGELFAQLQPFLTETPGEGTVAELGRILRMSEGAVRTTLHRLRREFGEILRAEVRQTLVNPSEQDTKDEIRHLLACLGGSDHGWSGRSPAVFAKKCCNFRPGFLLYSMKNGRSDANEDVAMAGTRAAQSPLRRAARLGVMNQGRTCSQCGARLAGGESCPRCLMRLGLGSPEGDGGEEPPCASEKPGDRIGRYKLVERIGEGGMGVVYLAEQEEPVRRRVALKIIKLGMDTRQVVARFEAERQALAMMDHPNIAKVLDAGATETGRPYFVMELVRGTRVTQYCDEKRLSVKDRLDLFIKVCRAVQHAHQKGIIHRDLKPSNVLVADHDGMPVPKIIDFGIAKATAGDRLTDKTVYTAPEQFIGTPAYTSPEQAKLSGLDVDTRSDIYSLGVLLYELLVGKTPFDTKRLIEAGLGEICRIIQEEEPPRPSQQLTTLGAEEQTTCADFRRTDLPCLVHLVRGDLDWIVMKCLQKDRNHRYETANGLAMDLQRHQVGEPVLARPPSNLYRFWKLVRRHRFAVASAGAVALALLAATGVSLRQAAVASRARGHEVEANRRLRAQMAETDAVSQFLTDLFQSPDPARDGHAIKVVDILGVAGEKLETELADQPARQAKLRATLAATYDAMGLYREAVPLQEKVRDYYLGTAGPEHPNTVDAMNNLARSYYYTSRRAEAVKLLEEALVVNRKVSGPEHPATLTTMQHLANAYDGAGRADQALKLREEVLALSRKVNGPEHSGTLMAMHNLANSYAQAGRRGEALKLREEVLALSRRLHPPGHPDTLMAMNNLSLSYHEAGRLEDALKLWEEAVALYRKVSSAEHPDMLRAMSNLAASYDEVGRQDEALKLREEALANRLKVDGPKHPDTHVAMYNLAHSYAEAGRPREAIALVGRNL